MTDTNEDLKESLKQVIKLLEDDKVPVRNLTIQGLKEALDRISKLECAARIVTEWYGVNTPGTDWPPGMKELKQIIEEN